MLSLVLAVSRPWFSWIPFVLIASTIGLLLALFVGYYFKVTANKNPRD
jgi:ABC-type multidrug transport system permease subunit